MGFSDPSTSLDDRASPSQASAMNRQVSGRAAGPFAGIFLLFRPTPWLGEHTVDVLASIGMDEHEIEALRARVVV